MAGFAHRYRFAVVAVALVCAAAAAPIALSVAQRLGPAGFTDPATESARADGVLAAHAADVSLIVLVRDADAADRSDRASVRGLTRTLSGQPLVSRVAVMRPPARGPRPPAGAERTHAYLLVYFVRASASRRQHAAQTIEQRFAGTPRVAVGGPEATNPQLSTTVQHDVERAELLGLPLLFLISLLVFRSLLAAALPPLIGGLTILGTFVVLRALSGQVSISVLSLNLVTALGLGLAVDYTLFVVSRYREELVRHGPGVRALSATMMSAGRTVLFSALTIAAVMAALIVFPQSFLSSMGVGGVAVALLSALTSLVVLPAILALLGDRINAFAPAWLRRNAARDARAGTRGGWFRLSMFVKRRAGWVAAIVATLMVATALPALGLRLVPVDASVLPDDTGAHQVYNSMHVDGTLAATTPIHVIARDRGLHAARITARQLERLPGVSAAHAGRQLGPDVLLRVVASSPPNTEANQALVRRIRAFGGSSLLVTGETARFVDLKSSLADHLPLMGAIVAASTMLALFLMTGSIVLGIKTLLLNIATYGSVLGLLILIFQDGRLQSVIGYHSQGALEATVPMLLFAAVFALSTDYGVFLLSRIKESRDQGADDEHAVAIGQQRTGRSITAAALLFCIAVGSFATSSIVGVKETTLGIALAVVIDATLVRALLMPALMHLLGRWNWWSPRVLQRVHARVGLTEHDPAPPPRPGDRPVHPTSGAPRSTAVRRSPPHPLTTRQGDT